MNTTEACKNFADYMVRGGGGGGGGRGGGEGAVLFPNHAMPIVFNVI